MCIIVLLLLLLCIFHFVFILDMSCVSSRLDTAAAGELLLTFGATTIESQ